MGGREVSWDFVKLYSGMLDSTIWLEPGPTRLVWVTLLLMGAPNQGKVTASVPGLARRANVTREECEAALAVLSAPDPDSKTPDFEGRRIRAIDGGWEILNAKKYIDMRTEKQVATAERVKRFRQRKGKGVTVTDVTQGNAKKRLNRDGDRELLSKDKSDRKRSPISRATRFLLKTARTVWPGIEEADFLTTVEGPWGATIEDLIAALQLVEAYTHAVEAAKYPEPVFLPRLKTFWADRATWVALAHECQPDANGELSAADVARIKLKTSSRNGEH